MIPPPAIPSTVNFADKIETNSSSQWRRAHWARSGLGPTLNTPSRARSGLVRSGQVHILDTCLCCITTGVRQCLGDWTSRDIYLKSYHSDLAAIYLDYFYYYSLQDRCPYLLGYL